MIRLFKPFVPKSAAPEILKTLYSGYITQGPKVDKFESDLGQHIQNKRVLSVNSGTSAIQLALRLANVGPGDEVITTPMTCIATNVPIMAAGADIVWADVDPYTGLIDPVDVERKITPKTKAIISVDWGGVPVDYDILNALAIDHSIAFISDAAHSLGASYEGRPIGRGTLADFTCFSFQAIKTITTIDGGALAVANPADYERGKRLRWFGVPRDSDVAFRGEINVQEWGYKFHMNDVNATLGIVALRSLSPNVKFQQDHARRYTQRLAAYYECHKPKQYKHSPAWWLFTVLVEDRDKFKEYMTGRGIEVSQVHWRNDEHAAFSRFRPTTPLKGLDYYSQRMICIPNHNQLTIKEIDAVIEAMNDFAG